MSDLNKLKELAKDTAQQFGAEWDSALVAGDNGNYHAIICEEKDDFIISTDGDKRENSWLCDYLEAVDPKAVIDLIERLEAAENRVAEMEHRNHVLREQRDGETIKRSDIEAQLAALAAQEPVAYSWKSHPNRSNLTRTYPESWKSPREIKPLYTHAAPPAPAVNLADLVPDELTTDGIITMHECGVVEGFNACRAEMLRRIEETDGAA